VNYIFVTFVKSVFMEDRLLKLLDTEQLTSAKFADAIGVQRSSVSHILSGRNKPSFDFLQKTLRAFPMLNADWLILGEGNMYEGDINPVSGSLFDQVPEGGQKPSKNTDQTEESEHDRSHLSAADAHISEGIDDRPEKSYPESGKADTDYSNESAETASDDSTAAKSYFEDKEETEPGSKGSKVITRVLVFYADKTFDSYEKGD
jgi:transcriptional regulator with XRE-family HTH domain